MTVTFQFEKTDDWNQEFSSDIQLYGDTLSSNRMRSLGTLIGSYSSSLVNSTALVSNYSLESQTNTSGVQSSSVIPLLEVSFWQLTVLSAIDKLARLPDDWDGYGSLRIQKAALARAIRLLLVIEIEQPPIPCVSPVPGGGIQFEWQTSTRELELEILPDGSIEFLTVLEGDEMEEGRLSLDQVDSLVQRLVRWLMDK